MSEDNKSNDPQDNSQGGGTNPPAQDQPVEETPAAPVTEAPAETPAEEPKAEEPKEEAPAEPAAEPEAAPVEETPAEEPKAEEPVTESPVEEPKAEEPAAEPDAAPVAETPAEEPKAEEPVAEAQAEEPKTAEPTAAPAEAEAPAKEAAPTEAPTKAAAPTETAPTEAKPADDCGCPVVTEAEWDKQKKTIDKAFYKTWSPRLMYYPFSFAIDITRAQAGAKAANYTVPENGMILDTGGMFWSSVMIEVTGENAEDKNVVSLKGKEVYTKVSKRPWNEIRTDIEDLKKELGAEPKELYLWYTACPKCMESKEVKTVLIAVQ
jgi:flagellar motor protein MotB